MARRPRTWPAPVGRPATWDDLDKVPEDLVGEIVGGQIVVTPRPNLPHARTTSRLGMLLGGPFELRTGGGPGGWVIIDEPRVRFGEEIRVPDLAGWRKQRWAGLPAEGPIPLVPDWICEVLSRSTETEDRTDKMSLYARAEVPHLWLINPLARTLEVYRLESAGWLRIDTFAEDQKVRAEPFDAVDLDLSLLWETAVADESDGV